MISITPIPAFNDNYLWLIHDENKAVVVDPGDPDPINRFLKQNNLNLVAILITHHHRDHTGGLLALKNRYNCRVIGPLNESIEGVDIRCQQDDLIAIDELKLSFKVIDVPGHTAGHIAYFAAKAEHHENLLFCGDTLFSAGCGRLFEGTASQMWHSISKLMALPDDTQIYPAHEYTLSNIEFALSVEPGNQALIDYNEKSKSLRNNNIPTLPAILATEKAINPFMRVQQPSVIKMAESRSKDINLSDSEVFAVIRHWKDTF